MSEPISKVNGNERNCAMKVCPQCQSTDIPDSEPICIYCMYQFDKPVKTDPTPEKPVKEKAAKEKVVKEKPAQTPAPTPAQASTPTSAPTSNAAVGQGTISGVKVPPPYVPPTPKTQPPKKTKNNTKAPAKKKGKGLVIAFVILAVFAVLVFGAVKSVQYLVGSGLLENYIRTSKSKQEISSASISNSKDSTHAVTDNSEDNAIAAEENSVEEAAQAVEESIYEETASGGYDEGYTESEIPFEDSYMIPGSDVRYVTMEDVAGFSKEEVRIAINELYARHGRMFRAEELQEYFNAKSWYEPIYTPDDWQEEWLTDVECYNRDFLVNYRNTLE